jgi:hypothetical protein
VTSLARLLRRRSAVRITPPPPTALFSFDSISVGLIVVLVAATPAISNPAGLDSFTAIKAALVQFGGPIATVSAVLWLWCRRRAVRVGTLHISALFVVVAFLVATVWSAAPAISFFAPSIRHEGAFVLLAFACTAFAVSTFELGWLEGSSSPSAPAAPSHRVLEDAFARLERGAALGDGAATSVSDAIFRATGIDPSQPSGRARAKALLDVESYPTLAAIYAPKSNADDPASARD